MLIRYVTLLLRDVWPVDLEHL